MKDVYRTVERILEYEIPFKHRYILSELNEAKCVQIRTTNWDTHKRIEAALKGNEQLNGTWVESWCEGSENRGYRSDSLEHGDIQVIQVTLRKETK